MDVLTHALSGALLGRTTAPSPGAPGALPLGRRIAVCTLAAVFPDSDIVFNFISPLAYLLQHRGITHSLILLPAWTFLLAWLAARIDRGRFGWRAYAPVIALGIGIHILGDLITSFGTMIWSPLSDRRVAWHTTFIIDLWFSGILIAGLIASRVWRRSRWPAVAGFGVLAFYVCGQAVLQQEARAIGTAHAHGAGLAGATVSALPRPPLPTNWMVIVEAPDHYDYALVSLSRTRAPDPLPRDAGFFARIAAPYLPAGEAQWVSVPRYGNDTERVVAREAWDAPVLGFYRWFAAFPMAYRIDRRQDAICVWFQDLRFLTPGRMTWPFRYGACRDGAGPWQAYQLEGEGGRRAVP
jgi:inner membrane protein